MCEQCGQSHSDMGGMVGFRGDEVSRVGVLGDG
jgi:hypothetical protein